MKITTSNYGEVVLWIYPVQEPFVERWEWLNYQLDMHLGNEDRTNFRKNPRLSLEIASHLDPEERMDAQTLLYSEAASVWGLPHWTHAEQISLSAGDTEVSISSGFFENGLAMFWSSSHAPEFREFTIGPGSSFVFEELDEDYTKGLIVPVRIGNVSSIGFSHTRLMTVCSFSFSSAEEYIVSASPPLQYRDYDLFYECPVTTNGAGVEDSSIRRIDILDGETGIWKTDSPWLCSRIKRVFGIDIEGTSEVNSFLYWLFRRKGMYEPFWTPSWINDLDITTSGVIGTAFTISNKFVSFCRQDIAVLTKNGDWFPSHITSAILTGPEIVLTLDTALGLSVDEIQMVCYLDLYRLDTDRIDLEYAGYRSLYSSFSILSVNSLPE